MPPQHYISQLLAFAILLSGCLQKTHAQYRPIEIPSTWTFTALTPAYSIENPEKKLGDYHPGITVNIIETEFADGRWRVAFKRRGQPDRLSLIDAPDLSKRAPEAFARVQPQINTFPILKTLLEAKNIWSTPPTEFAEQLFGEDASTLRSGTTEQPIILAATEDANERVTLWGIEPLSAFVDFRTPQSPKITIEIWNKGDAFQSQLNPSKANSIIHKNLEKLQRSFPTTLKDPKANSTARAITAVHIKEEVLLLPNELRVALRYDSGEYLLIEIESISRLEATRPTAYEPNNFKETIASKVHTSKGGHRYIQGIPMIDQGKKGYCAAATLARVLQYYGYSVDVHAMADLAKTEGQLSRYDRGGTQRNDIIKTMRRICNSTPFRLSEIKKERPETIREAIEQGIPIIWFVPGHARLLIGIHPETHAIVFSDSWGAEFQYQTASWDNFINWNREMWILMPR